MLRATNLALLLALPWIVSVLLSSFRPRSSKGVSSLTDASVIAFFPTLWFFGHLYYTDVGSVTLILAAWAASRRGRHLAASLVSPITVRTLCSRQRLTCPGPFLDAISWDLFP